MLVFPNLDFRVNSEDRVALRSTSKGDVIKWRWRNFWLKGNKFGYENIAEQVVSDILQLSSLPANNYVKYGLCTIYEEDSNIEVSGCYSLHFLNDNENLVTFEHLFEKYGISSNKLFTKKSTEQRMYATIDFIKDATGLDVTRYLRDILTLDRLILNEDRHTNNLAVIFNANTGLYSECPIFDNGLSLLSDLNDYPSTNTLLRNIAKVKSKPFSTDFKKQEKVLGLGFNIDAYALGDYMKENQEHLGRIYSLLKWSIKEFPEILN